MSDLSVIEGGDRYVRAAEALLELCDFMLPKEALAFLVSEGLQMSNWGDTRKARDDQWILLSRRLPPLEARAPMAHVSGNGKVIPPEAS